MNDPQYQDQRDAADRHGRAFGLTLDVGFSCPGLPSVRDREKSDADRAVRVVLAGPADREAGFPADAERLWEVRSSDERVVGRLDFHPAAGYVLGAEGYGDFYVAPDGGRVECVPAESDAWHWQRYLVGQVLPLVAVLHGLEVFHASVVARHSAGLAFLGASRAGKSSLAVALALRGARFIADDVVAVEADHRDPGRVPVAHPGFGLANVRHETARMVAPGALARLGPQIGTDAEGSRIAVPVDPAPIRITALYLLQPSTGGGRRLIEEIDPVDPRLLLASGYNFMIRTPERMARHLDVCARLARSAAVFRINLWPDLRLEDLASLVEDHSSSVAA